MQSLPVLFCAVSFVHAQQRAYINKWCKLARCVKAKEVKNKSHLYIQNINISLTTFLFLLENFYMKHMCCSVATGCVFGIWYNWFILSIQDRIVSYVTVKGLRKNFTTVG